jgi:ABC-type glycerol-3-phosphate transport system permease component
VKQSFGEKVFNVINVIFMALLGFVMAYPLWVVFVTSLVSEAEYYAKTLLLLPSKVTFTSYKFLLSTSEFIDATMVTVGFTFISTVYAMLLTVSLAYCFARKAFPGKKFVLTILIISMYFSGGLVPSYLLINKLGLFNNFWVYVLPAGVNVMYVLIVRNFIQGIPEALLESATIEGATELQALFRIIIPLSAPTLAAITLYIAVGRWNEWFTTQLYISTPKLYSLQYLLREMIASTTTEGVTAEMERAYMEKVGVGKEGVFVYGVKNAAIIVSTAPILIVYPFLQKHFAKGVMVGSVKG